MRPFIHSWLLLAGCAAAGTSLANPMAPTASQPRTDPLTIEAVLALSAAGDARISSDGHGIAYELSVPRTGASTSAPGDTGPGVHPRREIWLVPAEGGAARRASSPIFDAWQPRWAPDSRQLAFLSKRPAHHAAAQIFVMDTSLGEAAPLTSVDQGVGSFAWAPDGKTIAFTATQPPDEQQDAGRKAGRDWHRAGVVDGHQRLWLLDLTSRQTRSLISDLHVENMAWSPDSKSLLVSASQQPDVDTVFMRSELYRLDVAGGARTQLTRRAPAKLGDFAWSPNAQRIAFLAGVDGSDPLPGSLFVMPAAGGEARNLSGDYPGTINWVDWRDDETLVIAATRAGRTVVRTVPANTRGMSVERAESAKDDDILPMCYAPHLAADRTTYACAASSAVHPREVYLGRLAGSGKRARAATALARLTVSNPSLERVRFATQQLVRWKSVDGLEIEGVLIQPVDYRPGQRYPLVVLPHGGPEGSRENGWLAYPGQLLAARGMVAFYPNYRGSGGRGVAFGKADHHDLGGKEFDDVLAGIDHLERLGMIDPKRVGIGGWSYGGYFSAWAATRHSERFAAAVVGAAITNWLSFQGTTDIPDEVMMVHWDLDTYDSTELFWERSPLAHAAKARTPTLIVHGEADERVPVSQAHELYRALRRYGVDTELVTYPREHHGFREQAHIADVSARTLEWFERHLR